MWRVVEIETAVRSVRDTDKRLCLECVCEGTVETLETGHRMESVSVFMSEFVGLCQTLEKGRCVPVEISHIESGELRVECGELGFGGVFSDKVVVFAGLCVKLGEGTYRGH